MHLPCATVETPCGPFSVAVNGAGAVVASAFGDTPALRSRLPALCHLIGDTRGLTSAVKKQLREYFAGERRVFTLPLAAPGSAFQQRVWAELAAIPYGQTRSYGQLAAALEKTGAARAVGRANAANPLVLLVPCHRVINADGTPGGFAFGMALKLSLLRHERARSGAST
jgi:methylated-DNA-[protein]-cysteine S-methyltransferase